MKSWRTTLTTALFAAVLVLFGAGLLAQDLLAQDSPTSDSSGNLVLKTTVRRVVVDVVVTDSDGKPVKGLGKDDFSVAEDKTPQRVLSFDTHALEADDADTPLPKPPVLPANTYLNLPTAPERGPLYILLVDLVNTEVEDQMTVRSLLSKFVAGKPAGTRFAIFVLSDELRMVQGFTSDRGLLAAAVDVHHPKPHIPAVFLSGGNYGKGNAGQMVDVFHHIASFVDGLPGRKNLIWLSGGFPMRLFPSDDDGPGFAEQIRQVLDLMARNQISIYPVDARGVVVTVAHGPAGSASGGGGGGIAGGGGDHGVTGGTGGGGSGSSGGGGAGGGGGGSSSSGGGGGGGAPVTATPAGGPSQLAEDYDMEDQIATLTGGHAFYSNNDVATELAEATNRGASYYSLSYSPTNRDYDGRLRQIEVKLAKKGYKLAYRRSYLGTDTQTSDRLTTAKTAPAGDAQKAAPVRPVGDSLGVEMQYGAPMAHDLLFKAYVHALGPPAMGTPEQMANLADEPAYFRKPHRNRPAKALAPIRLQTVAIDYTLPASQMRARGPDIGGSASTLEAAAAAYDADGRMLNGLVQNAVQAGTDANQSGDVAAHPAPKGFYRIQMQLDVPMAATSLRIAVRDMSTDRLGTIDVPLPLTPEPQTASTADPVATKP